MASSQKKYGVKKRLGEMLKLGGGKKKRGGCRTMKKLADLTKVVELDVRDCLIYVGPKSCARRVSDELKPNLIHDVSDARLSVGRGLIVWPCTKISPTLKGILEGLKGLRYLRIDADALSEVYSHVGSVIDTLAIRALKRAKIPDDVVFPMAKGVMTLDGSVP